MSFETAISVKGLSKCFRVYEKPHHRLLQMLLGGLRGQAFYREFWALRDVSFQIGRGKVVGVLGKNGAGKSTLLQILCGTLSPSSGEIVVNGRIAALLELGAGFNPEFTGIENVYMNGQILGLSTREIDEKLGDIKRFADIGDFIFEPVKTYSSGMFARLAFSVAVNVDPDILIVDEALSVGDSWFQHKSMAKMRALMSKGCTVLLVSHSIDSIRALCDEAIWIESGRIHRHADVTAVTNEYMNGVFIEHNRIVLESADAKATSPASADCAREAATEFADSFGASVIQVNAVRIKDSGGEAVEKIEQDEKFTIEIEVKFLRAVKNISVGFLIKDKFGQELTGESVFNIYRRSFDFEAGQTVRFNFASRMMLRGGESYSIALRVNQVSRWDRSDNVIVYADDLAAVFDVLADRENPIWFKFKQPFEASIT